MDPEALVLIGGKGERTVLTRAELVVLETLLDAAGSAVSRQWLGRLAFRPSLEEARDQALEAVVVSLRRKISVHLGGRAKTITARRDGYALLGPERFSLLPPPARIP